MGESADVVVVGGGHNGLVCACYLARAGLDVLVLEQSAAAGGGSRTEETVPGYLFDTHSVAHNIINMTSIPAELDLVGAGLNYVEMEPFAAGFFEDGRIVRFHRSIEATVASIAEHDPTDAAAYRRLMELAVPLVEAAVAGLAGGSTPGGLLAATAGKLRSVWRATRQGGGVLSTARTLLQPYGALLEEQLTSELTRAPVSSFAAHAGMGPDAVGGAFFALWQAAYHLHGQWHARGGSGALTAALLRRLAESGGRVRTGAAVARIDAVGGSLRAVVLADGSRITTTRVVTAINPQVALLELLDPPLAGRGAAQLRAAHAGNAVQALLHVATTALPPYRNARPGDHNGLQSHVPTLAATAQGFRDSEARYLPDPVPTYAFTTSALDDSLGPPGHHTVYVACPSAPFDVRGGWDACAPAFEEAMLDSVERVAPGFRDTVVGTSMRTPAMMAAELRWPGAHPMHLDISLDQLAVLRPTAALAGHRTPVRGLYVSGAGTAPTGGIAGTPGRAVAQALLADLKR